jgi:hypothetical protein
VLLLLLHTLSYAADVFPQPGDGTISELIDDGGLSSGDTVYLEEGVFYESLNLSDITLTFVGPGYLLPLFDGVPTVTVGNDAVIQISDVSISGDNNAAITAHALRIEGGSTQVIGGTLSGMTSGIAFAEDGGIVAVGAGNFYAEDVRFTAGVTTGAGGSMYINGGTVEMVRPIFLGPEGANSATPNANYGGAISIISGFLTMEGGQFGGLFASQDGGVLHVDGPDAIVELNDCTTDSASGADNGGFLALGDGQVTVSGGDFTVGHDTDTSNGGFAYVTGGQLNTTAGAVGANLEISDGTAAQYGGGIYVAGPASVFLEDTSFSGLTANWGGAVFVQDSGAQLTTIRALFADNSTVEAGNDITVYASDKVVLAQSHFNSQSSANIWVENSNELIIQESGFELNAGGVRTEAVGAVKIDHTVFCDTDAPMLDIWEADITNVSNSAFIRGNSSTDGYAVGLHDASAPANFSQVTMVSSEGLSADVASAFYLDGNDLELENSIVAYMSRIVSGPSTGQADYIGTVADSTLNPAQGTEQIEPNFVTYGVDTAVTADMCRLELLRLQLFTEDRTEINPLIRRDESDVELDGTPLDIGALGGADAALSAFADADDDGWQARYDCDDQDALIHPLSDGDGAAVGIDFDCDGNPTVTQWFPDTDGDGYGAGTAQAVPIDNTYVTNGADCRPNDGDQTPFVVWTAADGDGDERNSNADLLLGCQTASNIVGQVPRHLWVDWDCDDTDDTVFLGALGETCFDDIDIDCNGDVDPVQAVAWYQDQDKDGYGDELDGDPVVITCPDDVGEPLARSNDDCVDTNPDINPAATELCDVDGDDEDCSGANNDAVSYQDKDNDNFGDPNVTLTGCPLQSGYVYVGGDCDDDNKPVNPTSTWYVDCDGDRSPRDGNGFQGQCDAPALADACGEGLDAFGWHTGIEEFDCDDADELRSPDTTEVCNGVDSDCNDIVDDGGGTTWYLDDDGDLYGDPDMPTVACEEPDGYVDNNDDCEDGNNKVHPLMAETCNDVDDDCNEAVDDDAGTTWYKDGDGDQYGDPDSSTIDCDEPTGYVDNNDDCDDSTAEVSPDEDEVCNLTDDDCNGLTDDVETTVWFDSDGDLYGDVNDTKQHPYCEPDDGWVLNDEDCNDDNDDINPGVDEVCTQEDTNCNGLIDDGLPTLVTVYVDEDDDDWGVGPAIQVCDAFDGYATQDGDCNDDNDEYFPGNLETYENCGNGFDEDCTGADLPCNSDDDDDDGWCGGAETCDDPNALPGDCDDNDPEVHPNHPEVCTVPAKDDDCDGLIDEGLTFDEDGDGYTSLTSCGGSQDDCLDQTDDVNPGAEEVDCDGLDNNCDGQTDVVKLDDDGDGYVTPASCDAWLPEDCDDADGAVHPGQAEDPTNAVDDDCDGQIDEDPTTHDDDGDGYCEATSCTDESLPGDCDDDDVTSAPGFVEVLDGADNDCDGIVDNVIVGDNDGDGWTNIGGDCDDTNPEVHPDIVESISHPETCNGRDDNCDGFVPSWEFDLDGDGYSICLDDCDDSNPTNSPWLAEDCSDNKDNNCNGIVDEDADQDGDGWTTCQGDCRDDPAYEDSYDIHPATPELCNNLDDDCDGTTDEGLDLDQDGWRDCNKCQQDEPCDCDDLNSYIRPYAVDVCADGIDANCDGPDSTDDLDGDQFTVCQGDCNDDNPHLSPAAVEFCDAVDNNCDGIVDEPFDVDGDLFSTCGGDCNDLSASISPGVIEECNLIDDNCFHGIDELWPDEDGDGVGVCAGDCSDEDPFQSPLHPEICDNDIDNDCDGRYPDDDPDCLYAIDTAEPVTKGEDFAVPQPRCQTGSLPWHWLFLLPVVLGGRYRRSDGD